MATRFDDLSDGELEYETNALYDQIDKAVKCGNIMDYQRASVDRDLAQAVARLRRAKEDILTAEKRLGQPTLQLSPELAAEIGAFLLKHRARLSFGSGWWIAYKGVNLTIDRMDSRYVSDIHDSFPGMMDELAAINDAVRGG